jgi:hypothetical protein
MALVHHDDAELMAATDWGIDARCSTPMALRSI